MNPYQKTVTTILATAFLLGAAVFISTCATTERWTEPPEWVQAVEFEPPIEYRAWWGMMQRCSGLRGDFDSMSFYFVVEPDYVTREDRTVGEVRFAPSRVYLPGGSLFDKDVVQHEMLHILLGTGGHPGPPFGLCAPYSASGSRTWDPSQAQPPEETPDGQ